MFGGPHGMRNLMSQETGKPKKASQTLARLGSYFMPFWPVLVLTALLVIISTWTQVTTPELTGQLVDCYLSPLAVNTFGGGDLSGMGSSQTNCWFVEGKEPNNFTQWVLKALFTSGSFAAPKSDLSGMTTIERWSGLGRMILILLGLYISGAILNGLTFFSMTWAGQHVLRQLRVKVFQHLHRLSLSYYTEHEAGDLMSRITNDTETIQQAINFALVSVASGVLLLVWIAYNMLTKSVPFALLSMSATPLMVLATIWFSSQARIAFRKTRKEMGSVNAELQESISAVREVQAFNRAEENIEQFRLINAANRDANVRAVAFTSALSPTLEALGYLALAIVTSAGGYALISGSSAFGSVVSLGVVITFLGYVQRFNQPIQQISILWTNIQSAVAGAERIFGLLDEKSTIQDAVNAADMPPIVGKVSFENVTAEYVEGQKVLDGISFTAEPGQTVAIVGPTGAGKTTIINLIPRFYDVTGGAVMIDGLDVRFTKIETLRKQIGIVLQDTFLFSTTVMENIRFGRPEASDEEVLAAARLARSASFIERLPNGYQTVLGERGSGVSQGQRQLLAIARAALANPRILILDEATSSVDTRTERLIQEALEKLLKGRTSFVIAHRLSTIRNADVVLVLDNGEIVERGKHEELLKKKGVYYHLYMSQFRKDPQYLEAPSGNGRKPVDQAIQIS